MESMMKRIFVLLVTTLLLTGCAAISSTPTPTPPLPPTAETPTTLPEPTDHTQLITVPAGETFELVVPSNPSTGYHWNILAELDASLVEFVQQNFLAQEPVAPGSGGVDVWTFRAISPGDTTIVLGYYPPTSETDPEETVTFSIHVE
jgi:inhibitor of cysteine peptidase